MFSDTGSSLSNRVGANPRVCWPCAAGPTDATKMGHPYFHLVSDKRCSHYDPAVPEFTYTGKVRDPKALPTDWPTELAEAVWREGGSNLLIDMFTITFTIEASSDSAALRLGDRIAASVAGIIEQSVVQIPPRA